MKLPKLVPPIVDQDAEDKTKITIQLPGDMNDRIKAHCRQYQIFLHEAYTSGMANWLAGMDGKGGYRPVYGPDHDALEAILRRGKPEQVAAIRAMLAAFPE